VIVLDPVPKSTTIMLSATVNGTSNATVQVEYSLDDPSALNAPATTWSLLSSATALPSSNIGSAASSSPNGLSWTVLSPIGQVRVVSTGGSSGGVGNVYTLKALQSVTA